MPPPPPPSEWKAGVGASEVGLKTESGLKMLLPGWEEGTVGRVGGWAEGRREKVRRDSRPLAPASLLLDGAEALRALLVRVVMPR